MSTKRQQTSGDNVIRFRATPQLKARIARVAKRKAIRPSELVRQAVADYAEREEAAAN